MNCYEVWVSLCGATKVTVYANSEEEARELAIEAADPFDIDQWDFDAEEIIPVDDEEGDE